MYLCVCARLPLRCNLQRPLKSRQWCRPRSVPQRGRGWKRAGRERRERREIKPQRPKQASCPEQLVTAPPRNLVSWSSTWRRKDRRQTPQFLGQQAQPAREKRNLRARQRPGRKQRLMRVRVRHCSPPGRFIKRGCGLAIPGATRSCRISSLDVPTAALSMVVAKHARIQSSGGKMPKRCERLMPCRVLVLLALLLQILLLPQLNLGRRGRHPPASKKKVARNLRGWKSPFQRMWTEDLPAFFPRVSRYLSFNEFCNIVSVLLAPDLTTFFSFVSIAPSPPSSCDQRYRLWWGVAFGPLLLELRHKQFRCVLGREILAIVLGVPSSWWDYMHGIHIKMIQSFNIVSNQGIESWCSACAQPSLLMIRFCVISPYASPGINFESGLLGFSPTSGDGLPVAVRKMALTNPFSVLRCKVYIYIIYIYINACARALDLFERIKNCREMSTIVITFTSMVSNFSSCQATTLPVA